MIHFTNNILFYISFVSWIFIYNWSPAQTIEIGNVVFTPQLVTVGMGETSIATSDFNSDGHIDVIFTNLSDNNLIFFSGDGQGSLVREGYFSAGENPTDIAVADINEDGNTDVVIANHEKPYITILIGDGLGKFIHSSFSPIKVTVEPHPHKVSLALIDEDDKLDLIVDSRDNNSVLILKGLGNGNFVTPGTFIDVGTTPYLGFATGDINNDGFTDIVTPNQNDVGILLNTESTGILFNKSGLETSDLPFSVELGDLNGDSNLDLIVVSEGEMIEIIPGTGSGEFNFPQKSSIKMARGAKQIAVGDINGDKFMDAIISNWSSNLLVILGGKNNFRTFNFDNPAILNPWAIALADLNEDSKCDIIVADGDTDKAVLFLSKK